MMFRKSCPRCNGDLYANRDVFGRYVACVQCGFLLDREATEAILSRLSSVSSVAGQAEPAMAEATSAKPRAGIRPRRAA